MWQVFFTAAVLLTPAAGLDRRNVVEYLSNQAEFTTLVSLVKQAGLADTLSNIKFATIFAPTNAAFAKVPKDTLDALQNNTQLLTRILLNHVTNHSLVSPQFQDKETFKNLIGETFVFKNDGTKVTVNGINISGTDVIVSNGIIHTIDEVLLINTGDIVSYLAIHDDIFSDLFASIILADLEDALKAGTFTIFAPNDKAFAAVVSKLPADKATLQKILKNHVVQGYAYSKDLKDGQKLTTIDGKQLTVSIKNGVVMVGGATVVKADIGASNGVLHEISSVLIPS